jgi:hypothetical protein
MPEAKVKAVPVNSLVEFVQKQITFPQLQAVIAKLPPDQQKYFSAHLLANELVPLTAVNQFTRLSAEAKGEQLASFGRRAGRYAGEQGIRSVYRFIMMVMSIESVLKKAPFMWTRVYNVGTLDVTSTTTSAKIRLRDFPSEDAGCARVTGWFEIIGESAGAKDVRILHTSCIAKGDPECVWDIIWTK